MYGDQPALLLSNDDGIDPKNAMVLDLASELAASGRHVLVCAPGRNNSACGQKISIRSSLTVHRHADLEQKFGARARKAGGQLYVFSIEEGTPADCVIVAIEPRTGLLARLGLRPQLMVSGVNVGANLGPDILYSGTFGAARQSAMYGIPALASSLVPFGRKSEDAVYSEHCKRAVAAAATVAERLLQTLPDVLPDAGRLQPTARPLANVPQDSREGIDANVRDAFARGDVLVNLNIPGDWSGDFATCRLDGILYRGAVNWDGAKVPTGSPDNESVVIRIAGGSADRMVSEGSDVAAIQSGAAALTTVSTWPLLHPMAVSHELLESAAKPSLTAEPRARFPAWVTSALMPSSL